MARFARLKWVPMLIQAYYDAQKKVQSQQGQIITSPETNEETPEMKQPTQGAAKPVHKPTQRRLHKASQSVKSFPQNKSRNSLYGRAQNHRRNTFNTTRGNRELLRQLQATNRKLEELEAIKSQLREFGMTMEGFSKEIERLTKKRESATNELQGMRQAPPHAFGQLQQPFLQPQPQNRQESNDAND